MRVALLFDMNACRGPTGVTRHALAQLEGLARRGDCELALVSGRITEPDGRVYWEKWTEQLPCHEIFFATRNLLRLWRFVPFPPLEFWTGATDWIYSPAEYLLLTRRARRAVTSHDILQDIEYGGPHRRAVLEKVFSAANLILSVSQFNTRQLLEAFPFCEGRVEYVPNGAEDLFFEPPTARERANVRADLGLRPEQPYLLSVANFQPRKNLERFVRAACRLPEVASGELALALVGAGNEAQMMGIKTAAGGSSKVRIVMPGYRQGKALRACYAEATALVFPSLCESFGIPAVEAMAQGCPVVLADSTALPEVGGAAGWYFPPESEEALSGVLREVLDRSDERARRAELGRPIAQNFRWSRANDQLYAALNTRMA